MIIRRQRALIRSNTKSLLNERSLKSAPRDWSPEPARDEVMAKIRDLDRAIEMNGWLRPPGRKSA